MNSKQQLKAIDFFCGAGGMTCGLRQAGINVIAGVDTDPRFKDTYEINNKPAKYINTDIRDVTEERLIAETGIRRNDDYLIFVGCNPCQFWSQVNTNREKSRETRLLLEEFQRLVEIFSPGFIVVENVPGLKKREDESGLIEFITYLSNHNYEVAQDIINAIHFGVPQNRIRYLLVASRVTDKVSLPPKQENHNLTVRQFIGTHNGFVSLEDNHQDPTDFMHSTAEFSDQNKKRIRKVPADGGTRLAWKDDPELQIPTYIGKDDSFKDVYGRMYWDRPAPTITTKFYSISNGRFGHPEEHRALSLREGATLQTFPKDYVFKGGQGSVGVQIGNAVPPELARRIGKHLNHCYRDHLDEEKNGQI